MDGYINQVQIVIAVAIILAIVSVVLYFALHKRLSPKRFTLGIFLILGLLSFGSLFIEPSSVQAASNACYRAKSYDKRNSVKAIENTNKDSSNGDQGQTPADSEGVRLVNDSYSTSGMTYDTERGTWYGTFNILGNDQASQE